MKERILDLIADHFHAVDGLSAAFSTLERVNKGMGDNALAALCWELVKAIVPDHPESELDGPVTTIITVSKTYMESQQSLHDSAREVEHACSAGARRVLLAFFADEQSN
ncbi:MAG: hypothetical protein HYZ63_02275 [Candidatus Andersenbacteria bacterium]|nr:hypothetical protein [Candidatus Andersenbacteria bacterium]